MKKLTLFAISISLVFTLAACKSNGDVTKSPVPSDTKISTSTINSTPEVLPTGNSSSSAANSTPSNSTLPTPKPTKIQLNAKVLTKPVQTDSAVVNSVKDALNKGNDLSFFDKFKTGTTLKIDDLKKYKFASGESKFLTSLKSIDAEQHDTNIYLVDIDNDGSAEIAISQFQGGAAGMLDFAVLKKNDKGEYLQTIGFNSDNGITFGLNNTLSFVKLNNKNYLFVGETDFSTKTFSGISIYRFSNGKYAECATVNLYSKGTYTIDRSTDNSNYSGYLKSVNVDDLISLSKNNTVKSASAEKLNKGTSSYNADINNDGKNEVITKSYQGTTSFYFAAYLDLKIKSDDSKFGADPLKAITGAPFNQNDNIKILQQFWCDSYNQKNLINVFYRNDFDTVYRLDVYLLDGTKCVKVGWIKATPDKNIGVKYLQY
jgi:hypothetical protein